MIASRRSLLLLGCLVWHAQAQFSIECGEVVTGAIQPVVSTWYEFVATDDGIIQPWTCEGSTADTMTKVFVDGNIVEQSDDLGPVVCPDNPQASGVTVHVSAGVTYRIEVSGGTRWAPGDDNAFTLDLFCNGPMEAYWENMFNNSNYNFSLLQAVNDVWYYNGVSTCVGKGSYWGICPFNHVYCAGNSTYGWGSDQVRAVLDALAEQDRKHPDFSEGCPVDLLCTSSQYTCVNLNCADLDELCDGNNDCGDDDNSDEDLDLTRGLCGTGGICTAHAECIDGFEYCNDQNTCNPCAECEGLGDGVDGTCSTLCAAGGNVTDCTVFGCMNPSAINYDPSVDCDDGSCETCLNGTGGPGPSLHLVTDFPSGLNAGRCGLASNGDLELSCHTSQKYPTSIISLLSPITGDQPFATTFNQEGRTAVTSPVYWSHSQGPVCDNTYDGVFAWSDVLNAGDSTILIRTDFDQAVMFTGWIAVDMFEQLDPLRDVNLTRWVRQKLPFRINFATDVTAVSSNIKVHDEWNTFFAIIEQKTIVVDSRASPPKIEADIVLWASVEYPFRLVEQSVQVNVAALNNGLTVTLFEDCTPAADQACNQKFLIHVDLEEECFFTGRYTVDFEVECLPTTAAEQCPLNNSTHTASVDFDIETENVCPTVVLNVISTGSVKSYQNARIGDAPYVGAEHFAFMLNNWAFFEVTMASVDGLIVETTIKRIDLCFEVGCANPTRLYQNGVSLVADVQLTVLDYVRDPTASPLPYNSDIQMYLSDNVFDVPLDGCIDFFLLIVVEVKYFHTQTLLEEGQERDMKMITAEGLRSTPKARKLLQDENAQPQSTSTTTSASGTITTQIPHEEKPAGDATKPTGSGASTISTTLGSLLAVAIAVALW